MSKLVNRHGPPMNEIDAREGAKYYRERGKTDGHPNGYIKVWTKVDRHIYSAGRYPAICPSFADNAAYLHHQDVAAAYLRDRCERVDPRDMPEGWRKALVPQTYLVYEEVAPQ